MSAKILIDGDACPVKNEILAIAKHYQLPVVLVISIAHIQNLPGAEVVQVDNAPEAVDMAIVNRVKKGDIVVTQDYGLASLVLAKGALSLSPRGLIYNNDNIEGLLMQRHFSAKQRQAGGRVKGPAAMRQEDRKAFCSSLSSVIEINY